MSHSALVIFIFSVRKMYDNDIFNINYDTNQAKTPILCGPWKRMKVAIAYNYIIITVT